MTRYVYDWSLLLLQCKVMESIVTNIMLSDDFEWAAALSLYLVRKLVGKLSPTTYGDHHVAQCFRCWSPLAATCLRIEYYFG